MCRNFKFYYLNFRDISIKDKNCILTSIYLECGDDLDRSYGYICPNTEDESLTAIMSMDTQRILALRLGKPITEFESDQSFIIRFNLYSAGLYICHEGCGNLFVDNFDFKTFENLISSTLADYDILQYNVYIELLNITNSTNFLSNFTVLGNSLIRIIQQQYLLYPEKLFNYNLNRTHYNVYTNPKLTQLRSCKCVKNLLILKNTKINKPLILTNTYIGEDCTIDENVVLKNCIILNNVCIKKDVYLKNCIVSNDCTIHSISNLTNCYLSANVIIGGVNGVHIVNRRLYPVPLENDGEDEPITVSPDMGSLANCFAYTSYARRRSTSMCSSYMETESDSSEEDFFDYDEVDETDPNKFTQSENEGTEKNMEIKFSEFSKLLYCTLVDSYNEKTNYENTIIEINSLKHAYSHVHITNLIELLIINLFKLTMKLSKETEQEFTVGIFCKFFEKVFQFYHPVINRYIKSHETAQMILLNAISTLYLKPEYETIFKSIQRVLHFLYNEIDVIDDHFIECWFDDLFKDAQNNEFLIDLKKFMEWMRQDDDESDEDTEDDSTRSSSRILSSNDL
ncbi:Translation initiation factor eIF-2B subunit epsilon [Intoshia linei]|uniref:Translation initiation factor eIF-2B subunit epsilon n=1 Tax=Intoshia linei TaxID=1819745 RepID=A0A177B8A5_9BILA|nr:Translation initiation factor eIF-2B subunit epsilon [Intoshia linei]